MLDFKNILAWQRAHALSISIHESARPFSRAGQASLESQITRSADSAAANIVEGCGAATKPEFARYLDIAIKSLTETEYHLMAARDHGLLAPDPWGQLTAETIEIRKMLHVYRRKLLDQPTIKSRI
jgi:four helix bundle protein